MVHFVLAIPPSAQRNLICVRLQMLETLVVGDVVAKHDLSNPLLSHLDGGSIADWDLIEF